MMETRYYQVKVKIQALATAFLEGDEAVKASLRNEADFFPISETDEGSSKAMMIRRKGEMFLIEDTPGGEKGVFALLQPLM
jgi:hypothetical protein